MVRVRGYGDAAGGSTCQSDAVTDGSRKAILAALFANLGIAIAKLVGFFITRSAVMLAEAIHSLADSGNQALLLLGGSRARKQATPTHPFGYGRERYFWSFAVSLVLFSVGGLFALTEGIDKLRHPHEIESVWVAVGILVFAIALETYSLRTAIKEVNHVRGAGVGWWKFIRTSKQPELPVVLLEDAGAELGLFAALGGIVMAEVTGDPRWDAAGSVVIGVLLIVIAVLLMVEMKGLLIGESASRADQDAITDALSAGPGVRDIVHLKTQHIGPDEILVAAKLEFDAALSFEELSASIDATEALVRAATPAARMIYIEPGRRTPAL
jgi:cation diffusion facilitator family transporter